MDAELAEVVAGVILATTDGDLDALAARALGQGAHLAICSPGVSPAGELLRREAAALDGDWGVASISLLDRAGLAALEVGDGRDDAGAHTDGLTTTTLGEVLRRIDLPPLSIAASGGALVVISRHALSLIPSIPSGRGCAERLAAWSAAAAEHALTHLLDLHTVVERRPGPADDPALAGVPLQDAADPSVEHARRMVRVAVRGIRVHIDGRTLETAETGTEVHTLQLIRSLAVRPEVSYLGVNLRGIIPTYAREILADRRINAIEHCGEWRTDLPEVDVFHRPYQPLSREDCDLWRDIGARTACHMQDLITFLSPEYHRSVGEWHRWRASVRDAVASVDGAFTLSEYVRAQMLREGMRGEPELLWPAPCGVDHIVGGTSAQPPELHEHRRPFALVLGSSYGHKNVGLALEAVDDARAAGCDLALVSAGRQVSGTAGGSRTSTSDAIHLGRNVSSAERNWLLANAAVVVFATSAEGFGLIPFEAAAYGSPTICVTFGALAEHLGELPVDTPDWSVQSFSRSIQRVVTDREAASAQVAAIRRAAASLTWDRTSAIVLRGYQEILRRPARG